MILFWNTSQTTKEKPHWVTCLSIILKRNWNKSWRIFYKSGWREGKEKVICIPCSCSSWCAFIFTIKEIFAFITNSITKTQKLLWSKWILHNLKINQHFSPTTDWLCKFQFLWIACSDRPRSPYNDFNLKIKGFKVGLSWSNNQWFQFWLCDYQRWSFEQPPWSFHLSNDFIKHYHHGESMEKISLFHMAILYSLLLEWITH